MIIDPVAEASRIQNQAASPNASVSLRASAGSGKTKVLVDRFIRLCVDDLSFKADPRSILAITFTRKAAVEIQERLLARTRRLALADAAELEKDLQELFKRDRVSASEMEAAAGLYEKILEDLSGLNVGTIHSFCQVILGRFAAEAGLDPHVTVLENNEDLVEEALDQLEREIASDPVLAEVSAKVASDPDKVRLAVRAAHRQRIRLDRWARSLRPAAPGEEPLARPPRLDNLVLMAAQMDHVLFAGLDLPEGDRRTGLTVAIREALNSLLLAGLPGVSEELGERMTPALEKTLGGLRDKLLVMQELWNQLEVEEAAQLIPDLSQVFVTTTGSARKFSRVKKEGLGEIFNELVYAQAVPLLELIRSFGYLELLETNTNLLHLVLRLMDICDDLKQRDQVIDFQDLEEIACRLMGDEARALSLLYRLDDSINHILLDEFQDTNFNQWDMLRPFVMEFLSGGADPDRRKTVFVVGDVKQSIYGFRGAEPELFPQVTRLLTDYEQHDLTLPTNFRSLEAVVGSVGCVFTAPPLADVLPLGETETVRQECARTEAPGQVVVLDPCTPHEEQDGDEDLDRRSGDQLAACTAARLAHELVTGGETTWDGFGNKIEERPLTWDDILVLCRTRTEIALYEKAFRDQGIPIVSSGRGMLAASRQVQDILALLRWLVYPEDDLALAVVLRSPIFRYSEEDFQAALALRGLHRPGSEERLLSPRPLWQSMRKLTDDERFGPAVTLLRKWRGHLGRESCHDLLRRIYREGHLLPRYQAAGGAQAKHNLLRLFDLSLSPEVAATPTVRRLIEVIDRAARLGGEEEAVTPPGENLGRVRFMTIHGAKGLEARVVILVDADRKSGKESPQVRLLPQNDATPLLFKVTKNYREGFPEFGLADSSLELAARQARQKSRTEDANLLYVAMTRARDRLFVLGGRKSSKDDHESPLRQLMAAADSVPCEMVDRQGPTWLDSIPVPEGWDVGAEAQSGVEFLEGQTLLWEPPVMRERLKVTTPSAVDQEDLSLVGTEPVAVPDGAGRQSAIQRGNLIHLLLQQAADTGQMPQGEGPEHAEARAVFSNPHHQWVFHPENDQGRGLSEAPVIHRESSAGSPESRITGIIDRLVVRPGRADIIDYKTNRTGGEAARIDQLKEHYRPQLEAYREVVGSLYPDQAIHTWLLFTDPDIGSGGGQLEEVL